MRDDYLNRSIYYNDNEIRIQQVFRGAMAGITPPSVFRKKGLLEFDEDILPIYIECLPDSIKIDKAADSITVYYFHKEQDLVSPVAIKLKGNNYTKFSRPAFKCQSENMFIFFGLTCGTDRKKRPPLLAASTYSFMNGVFDLLNSGLTFGANQYN